MAPSSALKSRSDLHIARKAWHILSVGGMATTYILVPLWQSLTLLIMAMVLFIGLDFLRFLFPTLNAKLVYFTRAIIRESEVDQLAGTTFLLIGVAILVVFFPRPVVEVSLLFLAIADPLASFVGVKFGSIKLMGRKSLQGFLAASSACTLILVAYLFKTGLHSQLHFQDLVMVSLIGGFAGGLAELLQIGKIDDNFSLPLLSGLFLLPLMAHFQLLV